MLSRQQNGKLIGIETSAVTILTICASAVLTKAKVAVSPVLENPNTAEVLSKPLA